MFVLPLSLLMTCGFSQEFPSALRDLAAWPGSQSAAGLPAPENVEASPAAPGPNVVLVTLDGVRWQEFLGNRPDPALSKDDRDEVFPRFWSRLAPRGAVFGDAGSGSRFSVSNFIFKSLPAYQSIFAGSTQPCLGNECGRVKARTFPERLIGELRLPRQAVAAFACWDKIPLAFESLPGATAIELAAAEHGREDETFRRAMDYLKARRPRFLYIMLDESDEMGHAGDYPGYLAALRRYDGYLDELASALDAMGPYGARTTLLVTTDHGRGDGADWKSHGGRPWAGRIWLYARGPRTLKAGRLGRGSSGSHVDIRPTVESLFGLKPVSCLTCGSPLPEVAGAPPGEPGSPAAR